MFIVHVHCSLFMFIVHCSHGATLIFDDVFLYRHSCLLSMTTGSIINYDFTSKYVVFLYAKDCKSISIQLTASSRRENGGAYGGDVFGGKWVVSKGKIFQITCSVSWYGRFWSTTNFWYSWKRAPLPPSSLAGSRRGTEASRAAA